MTQTTTNFTFNKKNLGELQIVNRLYTALQSITVYSFYLDNVFVIYQHPLFGFSSEYKSVSHPLSESLSQTAYLHFWLHEMVVQSLNNLAFDSLLSEVISRIFNSEEDMAHFLDILCGRPDYDADYEADYTRDSSGNVEGRPVAEAITRAKLYLKRNEGFLLTYFVKMFEKHSKPGLDEKALRGQYCFRFMTKALDPKRTTTNPFSPMGTHLPAGQLDFNVHYLPKSCLTRREDKVLNVSDKHILQDGRPIFEIDASLDTENYPRASSCSDTDIFEGRYTKRPYKKANLSPICKDLVLLITEALTFFMTPEQHQCFFAQMDRLVNCRDLLQDREHDKYNTVSQELGKVKIHFDRDLPGYFSALQWHRSWLSRSLANHRYIPTTSIIKFCKLLNAQRVFAFMLTNGTAIPGPVIFHEAIRGFFSQNRILYGAKVVGIPPEMLTETEKEQIIQDLRPAKILGYFGHFLSQLIQPYLFNLDLFVPSLAFVVATNIENYKLFRNLYLVNKTAVRVFERHLRFFANSQLLIDDSFKNRAKYPSPPLLPLESVNIVAIADDVNANVYASGPARA